MAEENKLYDLVAIGEILMDMTPTLNAEGQQAYVPNPGGAPCNVAVMAARLGKSVACVSKVGADIFGQKLMDTLSENNIDTKFVVKSEEYPTTLAFVHLDGKGERSFSFYRNETADVSLSKEEIELDKVLKTKMLCYGSVAMAKSPLRETCFDILEAASASGVLLAYDPNHRPLLWKDKKEGLSIMKKGLQFAKILKVSEEEAVLLSGEKDAALSVRHFLDSGMSLVTVTMGEKGVLVGLNSEVLAPEEMKMVTGENEEKYYIKQYDGFKLKSVKDTTGAGDAFFGALLASLVDEGLIHENQGRSEFRAYDFKALERSIQKAQAAAALCIGKLGAIPAMPSQREVIDFLSENER